MQSYSLHQGLDVNNLNDKHIDMICNYYTNDLLPCNIHTFLELYKIQNFQFKNSDIRLKHLLCVCVYMLEQHRRGGSNEYPQSMF